MTGVDLARRRIGRASAWGTDVGAEDVGEDDGGEEAELLGHGVDERPQRGDVGAQGLVGDEHEVLGEGDADAAGGVLLLRDAGVDELVAQEDLARWRNRARGDLADGAMLVAERGAADPG